MILDFSIIGKIDGISIYARNILQVIYTQFLEEKFIFGKNFVDKDILQKTNHQIVDNMLIHRMKFGFATKELLYSPSHHGPIFQKNKIITIHDITPVLFKQKSFKQFIYYSLFLRLSVLNTLKIITVSHFTKDKLIKKYLLDRQRDNIIVIHNGTDIDSVKEETVEDLPQRYLFMPGVHSDYKNYKVVLAALADNTFDNLNLVLTSTNPEIIKYCKQYPFVKVVSNLNYNKIKYLYNNSLGLIYPSLIEGFGLPALEAARLRVPVITSKNSSMQEFLGEKAAFYVDPRNLDEIKESISKVVYQKSNYMLELAYKNTVDLTWSNTASKVLDVIKSTMNG